MNARKALRAFVLGAQAAHAQRSDDVDAESVGSFSTGGDGRCPRKNHLE